MTTMLASSRMRTTLILAALGLALGPAGCDDGHESDHKLGPAPGSPRAKAEAANAASSFAANGTPAETPGSGAPAHATAAPAPKAEPPAAKPVAKSGVKPAGPLTEEEKRLIATPVDELAPEDRRRRAFALRKEIMQNPDSPAAKALEDARRQAEAGQLQLPDRTGGTAGGVTLHQKQEVLDANKKQVPSGDGR